VGVAVIRNRRLALESVLKMALELLKRSVMLLTCAFAVSRVVVSIVWAETDSLRSEGQTVYVPVYSHIYSGDRERPFDLASTVSIRNTDVHHSITVTEAKYYNSEGDLLKDHIQEPLLLKPLGTFRIVVGESDKAGGSGAKFIIRWRSKRPVNVPIVEAVMIGTQMGQGISFTSRGQVVME
jgi:hypothetical protein